MATSTKPTVKPAARLDGSLLLARKGEAQPAIHATSQNNPGLAWGGAHHPEDFQPQIQAHSQPTPQHDVPQTPPMTNNVTPIARPNQARLRPTSFMGAHTKTHSKPGAGAEQVAMTLRLEDETYLRLKYLAQNCGCSMQHVLNTAINGHLSREGLPRTRKLVVKPTDS